MIDHFCLSLRQLACALACTSSARGKLYGATLIHAKIQAEPQSQFDSLSLQYLFIKGLGLNLDTLAKAGLNLDTL